MVLLIFSNLLAVSVLFDVHVLLGISEMLELLLLLYDNASLGVIMLLVVSATLAVGSVTWVVTRVLLCVSLLHCSFSPLVSSS